MIALVKGTPRIVTSVRGRAPLDFAISSIAAHELYFGAFRSARSEENLARIGRLRIPIIEFDREDAVEAGYIRSVLAAAGTPIGPYDVLIAGQAKARNLVLITRNVRESSRVRGLDVRNWEDEEGEAK